MEINQSKKEKKLNYQYKEEKNSDSHIIPKLSIKKQIIKKIEDTIILAVTNTLIEIVKNNLSKNFIKKNDNLIGPYGGVDEEKIHSLINVRIFDMKKDVLGFALYSLKIEEKIFNILDMEIISTKNSEHLLKWIRKEILAKKLKAKMRNDLESLTIIDEFEKAFN